jgi:hypothetical protein
MTGRSSFATSVVAFPANNRGGLEPVRVRVPSGPPNKLEMNSVAQSEAEYAVFKQIKHPLLETSDVDDIPNHCR